MGAVSQSVSLLLLLDSTLHTPPFEENFKNG